MNQERLGDDGCSQYYAATTAHQETDRHEQTRRSRSVPGTRSADDTSLYGLRRGAVPAPARADDSQLGLWLSLSDEVWWPTHDAAVAAGRVRRELRLLVLESDRAACP